MLPLNALGAVLVGSTPPVNFRQRGPWGHLIVAMLALASLDCTKVCTAIGCSHQLSAKLTTATGAWIDGAYEISVRADDQAAETCKFRIPEQLPDAPGKGDFLSCGNGVRFNIVSQAQCQQACNANACWQSCTPIPGKFDARLVITGTPARIELTLVRDGQAILEEKLEPAYQDVYPNGDECGGACRQASLDFTIP